MLIPRSYRVQVAQKRNSTQFWQMYDGSKIAYSQVESVGVNHPTPIVYLHGGPGGMITNDIIEMYGPLSLQGYNLYFYDQIGSGLSDRLADINEYSVQKHVENLEEIIEKLGVEKVILIGQSWGALLAMEYVAGHSEKIEKLIFTGPGPILPIDRSLRKIVAPDSLHLRNPKFSNAAANNKTDNSRMRFIRFLALKFGIKIASDKEVDQFFTYLNTELRKSTVCDGTKTKPSESGGGYFSHIMTLNSFQEVIDKREIYKNMDIPALLLKGQCDNQPWSYTNEYIELLTNEYIELLTNSKLEIIENEGHIFQKESQQTILNSILDFLK